MEMSFRKWLEDAGEMWSNKYSNAGMPVSSNRQAKDVPNERSYSSPKRKDTDPPPEHQSPDDIFGNLAGVRLFKKNAWQFMRKKMRK